jgi:hypothetical protein
MTTSTILGNLDSQRRRSFSLLLLPIPELCFSALCQEGFTTAGESAHQMIHRNDYHLRFNNIQCRVMSSHRTLGPGLVVGWCVNCTRKTTPHLQYWCHYLFVRVWQTDIELPGLNIEFSSHHEDIMGSFVCGWM